MLETSSKHILCGAIIDNGEVTGIYCDPETGDCAYEGTIDGIAMLVGEISVDNPLPMADISRLERDLPNDKYAGAVGVILTMDKVVAIMPGEVAELRTLASADKHSTDVVSIDMDQVYEFTE